jgi:CRP-like cAMP-binding protein
MEKEQERPRFTSILHNAREKLGLSLLEYCVADSIYILCNNPDRDIRKLGWCYASKEYLGKFIGITDRAVYKIINRLIKKGIIEKNDKKYLKATSK